MTAKKIKQPELEDFLWKAANILSWQHIDASEFRDYIFGILLLKRLSDLFDEEQEKLIQNYLKSGETLQNSKELASYPDKFDSFFIPEETRWQNLKELTQDIGYELNKAALAIERHNPSIDGVLSSIKFTNKNKLPDIILQKLLFHFSSYSLRNEDLESSDILGKACEHLIEKCAANGSTHGSGLITPHELSWLLVSLLKPHQGMSIYDPTVGTGGTLIQSRNYLTKNGENPDSLSLYGQEINLNTWAICKMNMLLNGVTKADIKRGNVLDSPQHICDGELMTFDRVIAQPPFSQFWKQDDAQNDMHNRFPYGIPPKTNADFAFIQHMIASLNAEGMMGIITTHGLLYRSSSDKDIRKGIVDDDLLEAVIGLPKSVCFGTDIPTALLIFNKNKSPERINKVIIINAEGDFKKGIQRNIMRDEDIAKINNTFMYFHDVAGFSQVLTVDEIRGNDYNLSIQKWNIKRQISLLDTDYKKFSNIKLGELAIEVNLCKTGGEHLPKPNTTYIPKIGTQSVICNLDDAKIKHQNYIQIVCDPERCMPEYLSEFFNSALGEMVLNVLKSESTISSITKKDICEADIALPDLETQKQIIDTSRKLKLILERITTLKSNVAVNPLGKDQISQIDSVLDAISELAESDKIKSLIRNGESKILEFKETLSLCLRTREKKPYIEDSVIKTIGGFLNTDGGVLLVGVEDSGVIKGIEIESNLFHKGNKDKFLLHFKNMLKNRIGEQFYPFIDQDLVHVDGKTVLRVQCKSSDKAVYVDDNDFYVRTNPATDKLEGRKLVEYIQAHFDKS